MRRDTSPPGEPALFHPRRMPVPRMTPVSFAAALLAALLLPACRPPRALIGPVPADIREIEGDASLRITRDGRTSRSRFAFVLEPSRRGRVTVTGVLGTAAAEIVFAGPEGYFVLPSEKVYWKAAPEEIVGKFLGFPLSLDEMTGLLCGRWPAGSGGGAPAGWALDRAGPRPAGRAAWNSRFANSSPGARSPRFWITGTPPARAA
jgi:hypothetical protein